ncbi:hypothetical protein T484DRAFT_2528148 [Baffinella frigidus]|nr:hypothetical protein T484DRAFT_2528148 [Cryptophyta sp. CCMP2293]
MRGLLENAGFPVVSVLRTEVYDINSTDLAALTPPERTCTNPPLPPRPQCQDGLYILDGFLNVTHDAWGEGGEQVWVEVRQVTGPAFGVLRVVFPLTNSSRDAQLVLDPEEGRFGSGTFDVSVHDSGGTSNGGVDTNIYPSAIDVVIPGVNNPPRFLLARTEISVTQDSACVELSPGICDAACAGGVPQCVGGVNPSAVCSITGGGCLGNCSGGAFVPRSVSCTGRCSCGGSGAGSCSAAGICECDLPNTGGACATASNCTGGGGCSGEGTCVDVADMGVACSPLTVCSNRGFCRAAFSETRRHSREQFAFGITAGAPSEDGGDNCPPGTSVGYGCVFQTVSFTVVALNASEAGQLFAVLPEMSEDGTLAFNLTAGKAGSADFTVVLTDDSGDLATSSSPPVVLTINVLPVNGEPSFSLPSTVTVFEDSRAYAEIIAIDISSPNDAGGGLVVSFATTTSNPALFAALPSFSPGGNLTFTPTAGIAGTSDISVTMADNSRPAAGLMYVTHRMTIVVQDVNDIPTFSLLESFVSVGTNSAIQRFTVADTLNQTPKP